MSRRKHIFTPSALVRRLALSLVVLAALQLALLAWTTLRPLPEALPSIFLVSRPAFLAFQALALIAVLVVLWRTILYGRYRPVPAAADADLPALTVIIPAFNEGAQVFATVQSVMASDYPRHKLDIIAIDDGSVDDTWTWIQHAAAVFPANVVALRCPTNRGKREALYEGFGRAAGDVIVTIDSDSEVLPDALRNLVSPLVADPRIGAVSGNVRVLNRDAGAIPAMVDVLFTSSFEFIRATQSEVGVVMCCPGALSAYRRWLVVSFKDEWVTQEFLGEASTIGEDRAMTNLVLRAGYEVRFQANAIVLTMVPTRTAQLAKMFLRWARSDVRETIALARILWGRRGGWSWGAHVNLAVSALGLVMAPITLVWLLGVAAAVPALLAWTLAGALITATLPAVIFGHLRDARRAWWAFPYGLYFMLALAWIQPYALITPQRASWMTRALREGPAPTARTLRG